MSLKLVFQWTVCVARAAGKSCLSIAGAVPCGFVLSVAGGRLGLVSARQTSEKKVLMKQAVVRTALVTMTRAR